MLEHRKGEFSGGEIFNSIAKRDDKRIHALITNGYIEEYEDKVHNLLNHTSRSIKKYRLTKAGREALAPLHKKLWENVKGDIRGLIVSLMTAVVTSVVVYYVMDEITTRVQHEPKLDLNIKLGDQQAIEDCISDHHGPTLNFIGWEHHCGMDRATLYYYDDRKYSMEICKRYLDDHFKIGSSSIDDVCENVVRNNLGRSIDSKLFTPPLE